MASLPKRDRSYDEAGRASLIKINRDRIEDGIPNSQLDSTTVNGQRSSPVKDGIPVQSGEELKMAQGEGGILNHQHPRC